MKRKSSGIFWIISALLVVVSPVQSQSSQAAESANFNDPYYPIINDLRITPKIDAQIDGAGITVYPLSLKVSITVRVHHNSLAGLKFYYDGQISTQANLCQSLSGKHAIGSTDYEQLGKDVLVPLPGRISRTADGDWFLEVYQFEIPVIGNQKYFPCISNYILGGLYIRDISGKSKSFENRSDGRPAPISTNQPDAVSVSEPTLIDKSELPEFKKCPMIIGGTWYGAALKCIDNISRERTTIFFSAADKAAADAAADAAAALKAAIDHKTALDKAKADKESAKRASKEKTITCIKGKSSLKVIGKSPKCPTGYKKK